MIKKKIHKTFGKTKEETFGNFYNFLSTSKQGAEQQARRKYKIKILR